MSETDDRTRIDPGPTRIETDHTEIDLAGSGATDAVIGRVLSGKYEITEKLGQGGMGAVYRARHKKLDRDCAIKILPPELAKDEQMVQRFEQEARATAKLDQHNVVTIFDVDRDLGVEYLAMEFIRGESLDDRLRKTGALPWRKAVELVRQAACGLRAAHDEGIIHRDIKPANLMLTREDVVKVMDFGLARLAEALSHLSRTGQILGTPHYMSPEQAEASEHIDHRTDIYSLGATLYTMVAGTTPFRAPTPTALLLKVVQTDPTPPSEINADVPEAVGSVIAHMMARDAEARPASMTEVITALDALLAGEAPPAPLPTLPRAARPEVSPRGADACAQTATGDGARAAAAATKVDVTAPPRVAPGPGGGLPKVPLIAAGGVLMLVFLVGVGLVLSGVDPSHAAYEQLEAQLASAELSPVEKVAACQTFLEAHPDSAHAPQAEILRDQWKAKIVATITAPDGSTTGQPKDPFGIGDALKGLQGLEKWSKGLENAWGKVETRGTKIKLKDKTRIKSLQKQIERLLAKGKIDEARGRLTQVITEQPDTPLAEAAEEMLEWLENYQEQ